METDKETVGELVGEATIERLAEDYEIETDEVELLIQAYLDAKALVEMCGSGRKLQLENFFPDLPVPEGEPMKKTIFEEVEEKRKVAARAKRDRDASRAMHDQARKNLSMPPLKWTHGKRV